MLERATASASACLKAGAQSRSRSLSLSMQCAQKQQHPSPRSKRMLHQTFWAHGGGELDVYQKPGAHSLPPYATSATPPAGLPLRHDSRASRPAARSTESPLPSDTVFLDFLYPPQALAWLNGITSHHKEPWEKRNSRRLPEGFTQASRGYSSKSYTRFARDGPAEGSRFDADDGFLKDTDAVPRNDSTGGVENTFSSVDQKISHMAQIMNTKKRQKNTQSTSQNNEGQHQYDQKIFTAGTPGDLAEGSSSNVVSCQRGMDNLIKDDPPAVRFDTLKRMLHSRAEKSDLDYIRAVWKQYLSLAEHDKGDPRLKEKLLAWFVESGNTLAAAYCVTLYWYIPAEERTLQVYLLAAHAFIRQRLFDSALALHEEALHRVINAQMVSLKLFEMAMDSSHWETAVDVVNQHHEHFLAQGRSNEHEIFWIKVLEMPQLMLKAFNFAHYLDSPTMSRPIKEYLPVCQRLIVEAARLSLQDLVPREFVSNRRSLYYVLHFIRRNSHSNDRRKIFEEFLLHRLQLLNSYVDRTGDVRKDTWSHPIISLLYQHYRTIDGAQIPQHLLLTLLKQLSDWSKLHNSDDLIPSNTNVDIVIQDWIDWHGKISLDGLYHLIKYYATEGNVEKVAEWRLYLSTHYPSYVQWKGSLWTSIYVHARRSDAMSAAKAFKAVELETRENNDRPDTRCWNVLIYAYERAHDSGAAFSALQRLIESGVTPDIFSFQPSINMMAQRGEVEGVQSLIQQYYDTTGQPQTAAIVAAHVKALCKANRMHDAVEVLREAMQSRTAGNLPGRVTQVFDVLLGKYASQRDINAVMRVYRWMKAEKISLSLHSYAHLMQALVNFRQTNAAWSIARHAMRQDGYQPTADHYTIAILGFNRQGEYQKALRVYAHMLNSNVRPNLSVRKGHIETKVLIVRAGKREPNKSSEKPPLNLMQELHDMVASVSDRDLAQKEAAFEGVLASNRIQNLFTSVANEEQDRLEEVKQLFQRAREASNERNHAQLPIIHISASLMRALARAQEFEQVEALWRIVKDQADMLAAPTFVPDFRAFTAPKASHHQLSESASQHKYAINDPILEPSSTDDRAEIGFPVHHSSADGPASTSVKAAELLPADDVNYLGPRPVPGRSHILNKPFNVLLRILYYQNRMVDMIREVTRLLNQGYTLENETWNKFVQYLCRSSPPYALLAFTLTERYLISRFPGWESVTKAKFRHVYKSDIATGTQYIRTRYLPAGALMVKYRTMVWLAHAMMDLKQLDASELHGVDRHVKRFVGSMRLVREKAPKTLAVVKMMPRVDDRLQNRVLRRSNGLETESCARRGGEASQAQRMASKASMDGIDVKTVPKQLAGGSDGDGTSYGPFRPKTSG